MEGGPVKERMERREAMAWLRGQLEWETTLEVIRARAWLATLPERDEPTATRTSQALAA